MLVASMRPLVLLHGLGTGPRGWAPQVEAFGSTREVLTPALPLDFGAAVAAVEDAVGGRSSVDVCGLSLGALVGLLYAEREPTRVDRLVLSAGFVRLPVRYRLLQALLARTILLASKEKLRRQLVADVPEPYRDEALEDLRDLRKAELIAVLRRGARLDLRATAAGLDIRTLVLCGERDARNLPLSRALARTLPHAELRIVADAGHVANLDNTAAFNAALVDFLDGGRP
jgi:pimeloyl-ACP methyl ester carboxylesterase